MLFRMKKEIYIIHTYTHIHTYSTQLSADYSFSCVPLITSITDTQNIHTHIHTYIQHTALCRLQFQLLATHHVHHRHSKHTHTHIHTYIHTYIQHTALGGLQFQLRAAHHLNHRLSKRTFCIHICHSGSAVYACTPSERHAHWRGVVRRIGVPCYAHVTWSKFVCKCVCVCMYTCIIMVYVCLYVRIHVCVCVCIYIYIYISDWRALLCPCYLERTYL
jgi:hypothetical protein